jgi:hypothetical protein
MLPTLVQSILLQGGSNMTGTDLCVNSVLSVPVIFEPPCTHTHTHTHTPHTHTHTCPPVQINTSKTFSDRTPDFYNTAVSLSFKLKQNQLYVS